MRAVKQEWLVAGMVCLLALGCSVDTSMNADILPESPTSTGSSQHQRHGVAESASHVASVGHAGPLSATDRTRPRATFDTDDYDFGVMPPHSEAAHTFVIRNEGTAPLILSDGGTSCNCTVLDFPRDPVPPGGEAALEVKWTTSAKGEFYQQATVKTNDRDTPKIVFSVQGSVLHELAWAPDPCVLGDISPHRRSEHQLLLYSHVWSAFELRSIETSWEGVEWTIEDPTPEELTQLGAPSGKLIKLTFPEGMEIGHFQHWFRATARPTADAEFIVPPTVPSGVRVERSEVMEAETLLSGKILRPFCLYGEGISPSGKINLGQIHAGDGKHARFIAKVRDNEPNIALSKVTVEPPFLNVTLLPMTEPATPGLYYLDINIPTDAPVGTYRHLDGAKMKLEFDHPRIRALEFPLNFSIVP